jgi:hypothetical protein
MDDQGEVQDSKYLQTNKCVFFGNYKQNGIPGIAELAV